MMKNNETPTGYSYAVSVGEGTGRSLVHKIWTCRLIESVIAVMRAKTDVGCKAASVD